MHVSLFWRGEKWKQNNFAKIRPYYFQFLSEEDVNSGNWVCNVCQSDQFEDGICLEVTVGGSFKKKVPKISQKLCVTVVLPQFRILLFQLNSEAVALQINFWSTWSYVLIDFTRVVLDSVVWTIKYHLRFTREYDRMETFL